MDSTVIDKIVFKETRPDINEYMSLFNSTGWNDEYSISAEQMSVALDNSWYLVSAYCDEKLVGFGRVVTDLMLHAMIYEMITQPEYQGKGIGKRILKMLVDKCKQHGIRDIQLFCAKGKKEFYIKNGFESRPEDAPGMQYKKE